MSKKSLGGIVTATLAEKLIDLCEEHEKFRMTGRGESLWKEMKAIVAELARRGDQDTAIALMNDPRPVVRFCAAELAADLAPAAMRKTLVEIAEGDYDPWLKNRATRSLGLRFRDYFAKAFGAGTRIARDEEAKDPEFAAYMEGLRATSRRLGLDGFKRYEHVVTESETEPKPGEGDGKA